MNFNLKNESETVIIEILGGIGESWFEDDTSMQKINTALKDAKGKSVELRIASLGGDVDHAFVIHDLLKMHNAPVTAKIMGATASSGTIVAMGADKVEMSENSLFLIHNVWTFAMGNANELRETADDLDKFDDRVVNIYKNKTGKRKSQIYSLMEEEKWIDAQEAKEFGFIDNIFTPKKAAAAVLTQEQKDKLLNDLRKQKLMEKKFDKVNQILDVEGFEMDGEGIYLNLEQIETINTKLDELEKAAVVDNTEAIATAVSDAEKPLNDKVEALTGEVDTLKADIDLKAEELKTAQARIEELEAEASEKNAKGIKLNKKEPKLDGLDPELTPEEKKLKENAKEVFKEINKFGV